MILTPAMKNITLERSRTWTSRSPGELLAPLAVWASYCSWFDRYESYGSNWAEPRKLWQNLVPMLLGMAFAEAIAIYALLLALERKFIPVFHRKRGLFMDVLQSFGFDIRLLIASTINFVILLLILNKILTNLCSLYWINANHWLKKPIKNAETVEKKLAETVEKERQTLHEARLEAEKLLNRAEEHAKKRELEILKRRNSSYRNVAQAKKSMDRLRIKCNEI